MARVVLRTLRFRRERVRVGSGGACNGGHRDNGIPRRRFRRVRLGGRGRH